MAFTPSLNNPNATYYIGIRWMKPTASIARRVDVMSALRQITVTEEPLKFHCSICSGLEMMGNDVHCYDITIASCIVVQHVQYKTDSYIGIAR